MNMYMERRYGITKLRTQVIHFGYKLVSWVSLMKYHQTLNAKLGTLHHPHTFGTYGTYGEQQYNRLGSVDKFHVKDLT